MHTDRELVEKRIRRELWERVLPLVHSERLQLIVEAGPSLDQLDEFTLGSRWGPPWGTTWFRFSGDIPAHWADGRVEAVLDLGFHPDAAGFQCEGLVVEAATDGALIPQQGIHPRRTNYRVEAVAGPVQVLLEAASNPTFVQFVPSRRGSLDTADDALLYRTRRADLVLVDPETEALAHDIEVLDGMMRALAIDDPRRTRIRRALVAALDRVPDIGRARTVLAPLLSGDAGADHTVIAIGHAHIDTAWLWPTREAKRKCARTFASAVALMDDYPEYKFVASSAQHYSWIEDAHPVLFEKITERVECDQWIPIGGMWVEADMNLPSGESLARQIVFGQRYFEEKFGRRCREAWLPDVFGYPAGLPQLFVAGGMDRFVTQKLSWNKQNKFPHHTFYWEGLDGTRVLTHFPPVDTYNAELEPIEIAYSVSNFREHEWSNASLMPFGYGDGGGGPTREMLERARRLSTADPAARIEIGTPNDLFTAIEREISIGAQVPVWRGELYFETHRGTLTSQLRTKSGNRRCERLLVEAELWAASLGRRADIDHLWKAVLTQQFHDILPGSSIAWVHDDAEAVFAEVAGELEGRIDDLLAELAPSGTSLANPSDTAVDAVVLLEGDLVDSVLLGGEPAQVLPDGMMAIRVAVPAFGVVAAAPAPATDRVVVSDSSMINRHLAVRWDAVGNITSIIDLSAAREIVPPATLFAVLELAPDHPVEYDAWDLESWTRISARPLTAAIPSDGGVAVEVEAAGPLVARVRVERSFGPSTAVVTYELRADSRQFEVHVDLDWQHDEHLLSMAFPLDVRADVASCDVQFGVVSRPTHPSSPWDAAKFEVCAHRYVDLSEPDFGVAVLNTGRYGYSLFGGAIRASIARAARYPDPDADRGRHAVTFAVRTHDAGLSEVRAAASNLNAPVRLIKPGTRSNDVVGPLISIAGGPGEKPPGIDIDVVKMADDGSGDVIVRLHEACGNRVRTTLRAAKRISAAWQCNLMEESTAGEEVGDGVVSLMLRPFQLMTLRLRLDTETDGRSIAV